MLKSQHDISRHMRSLGACIAFLCCTATTPLGTTSPKVVDVYEADHIQRELPGDPELCTGDNCAALEAEINVGSRVRGASCNSDSESFGQDAQTGTSSDGTVGGKASGRLRIRVQPGGEAIPSDCELRRRADPSVQCKSSEGALGDGTSGGQNGPVSGTSSGSGSGSGGDGGDGHGDGSSGNSGNSESSGNSGSQNGQQGDSDSGSEGSGEKGSDTEGVKETGDKPPEEKAEPPEPKPPEDPEMPEVEEPDEEPPSLMDILRGLVMLAVVFFVVMIVLFLARMIQRKVQRGRGVDEHESEDIQGGEELIEELEVRTGKRDHVAWAGEERYEEAIHALLLLSLKDILSANAHLTSPSLTSREILERAKLNEDEYQAFSTLVKSAELCIFARRQATVSMYNTCVTAQELLRQTHSTRISHMSDEGGEP